MAPFKNQKGQSLRPAHGGGTCSQEEGKVDPHTSSRPQNNRHGQYLVEEAAAPGNVTQCGRERQWFAGHGTPVHAEPCLTVTGTPSCSPREPCRAQQHDAQLRSSRIPF